MTRVLDADGHVVEPPQMFEDYVPDSISVQWRAVTDVSVDGMNVVDRPDAPFFVLAEEADRYAEPRARGFDVTSQLTMMDQEGFDVAALFPSKFLYLPYAQGVPPDTAIQLSIAYDNWLHDYRAEAPDRLIGVAPIPLGDLAAACEEARRAIEDLGCRAVMVRPNPVHGRTLGNRFYDPLYDVLEDLGATLCVHEGLSVRVPQLGRDRFHTFFDRHMCSHPFEQMTACLSLIAHGALERHPRLRVAFLESGSAWVPYWLDRMDEHAEIAGPDVDELTMSPSEYFRRQCWISTGPDDGVAAYTVDYLRGDNLVFASDYPHPDAAYPGFVETFRKHNDLDDETAGRVLWENGCAMFGLDP